MQSRGTTNLPYRVHRHDEAALRVAEWLHDRPAAAYIRYLWHPSHVIRP